MKTIKIIIVVILYGFISVKGMSSTIDTLQIFVNGSCEMCKDRIENIASKEAGVTKVSWALDTKKLTVIADEENFILISLHKALANAGHDTDLEKAPDDVYNNLPDCCKYRTEDHIESNHAKQENHEHDNETHDKHNESCEHNHMTEVEEHENCEHEHEHEQNEGHENHNHTITELNKKKRITGTVSEPNDKGTDLPLIGANLYWAETSEGTITNKHGHFRLKRNAKTNLLVVSFVGYENDTIDMSKHNHVDILMSENNELETIDVIHRQRATTVSFSNAIKEYQIKEAELQKAACCNLSESFETNPAIDVTFTDAVTGTKQIEMLGLAGKYVQIMRENMPDVRKLSALHGLTYTPGPWIESIQLNMGTGSVVNGYESITGQINVELQKPENSRKLYLNLFANQAGRIEANLNTSHKLNETWSTAFLLHSKYQKAQQDHNNDGFIDHPVGEQIIAVNRWKFNTDFGLQGQFGIKGTYIDNTSGQKGFIDDGNLWGAEMKTKRAEAWLKTGYVFQNRAQTSIGFQFSGTFHQQDALFGKKIYDANQENLYSNLIFQSFIGNTAHTYKTGLSFQADKFDEDFISVNESFAEKVPGAFFEYSYIPNKKFSLIGGLRGDFHSIYGAFLTPRVHLRYAPYEHTVMRLTGGRGLKTPAIFAENIGALASSRQWIIHREGNDKPYGLNPEIAWNFGFNITQTLKIMNKEVILGFDIYRTEFENQIVVDYDASPQELNIYNLDGKSYANSFQTQIDMEVFSRFDVRFAYRYNDVKINYKNIGLKQKPLSSAHRAFANFAYENTKKWKFDLTINWQGKKRIPDTRSNPELYQFDEYSPGYYVVNGQISKSWNDRFEIYTGCENLFNYRQKNAILSADNPFSDYFDGSLIWGPVFGRKIYAGLRFYIH